MDNRLRFLYRDMTELWGHAWKSISREWKDRRKRGRGLHRQIRAAQPEAATRTELRVGKYASHASRKCRYRSYRARTANRHR